jgi:type I restriction enzyme, S subunit
MEKLQNKKPVVRFPEFNDFWEHKKLSDLLAESKKLNGDLKFSKDEVLSVSGECGIVNQIDHLGRSYAGVSVHQYHVVEVGDIVYTKSPLKANPFGIIKLNKGKAGIVSTLYAVYNIKAENTYGPFIDYYFSLDANTNRYLRPLVKKGAKNDMKINNAYVLHDRIFVPKLPEQTKIASFFTTVVLKLSKLKQKKTLLEQYKKGIMQKIFSREIRFKDENGKVFPEWEEKPLSEVAIKKSSNISANKIEDNFGDYIIYGASGILKKVDFYNEVEEYISIIKDGAGVGRIFYCEGKTSVLGTMEIIKPKSDINTYYLYCLLSNIDFVKYITGSTIPHIYFKNYSNEICCIPCLAEQTKIANFLSAIDEKINLCTSQIQKTDLWKKGLLQKMFV